MSENSTPTTVVTPYEEKVIDHADPSNWSRDPKRKPRNMPRASKFVDVPLYAEANPKGGLHPKVMRARWPELFAQYLPIDLVRSLNHGTPPPPEMECWIREIIEPGVAENMRGRFIMFIDPVYHRWTLGQIVNTKRDGRAVARVVVFAEASREGYLPPDLDEEGFRHLRGRVGDFKVPTRRDFVEIREKWDRRSVRGEEVAIRAGSTKIAQRLAGEKRAEYDDKNRVMNDRVRDMLEYDFRHVWRAANNGTKQWSNETIVPQRNPRKWRIIKKPGYEIKQRIELHELRAAEDELDAVIVSLQSADRGMQRNNYVASDELVSFCVRTFEPDCDVFALVEEGRALERRILDRNAGVRREVIAEHEHDAKLGEVVAQPIPGSKAFQLVVKERV